MIAEIEADIVAKIKAALPSLSVEAFPDRPNLHRSASPNGSVLVVYQRSTLGSDLVAGGMVAQERTLHFDLTVLVRDLRTHQGAYPILDALYVALLGFAPIHCSKIWITQDSFVSQTDGVWEYQLTLAMRTMAIEDISASSAPLATAISILGV